MERASTNFPGNFDGGRDQILGNHYHYHAPVTFTSADKPGDPVVESGDSTKLFPRVNDGEKKQPSLEGMLRYKTYQHLEN
jgi:hypothetical protein